jgi:NAD+ synthetase
MPVRNTDALITDRVEAIRRYHEDHGVTRAELDVSGGIDSATLLELLATAIGPDNVTAVYTGITSSKDSLERARRAAQACDVRLIEVELGESFSHITEHLVEAAAAAGHDRTAIEEQIARDPTVLGSFRSCLRAPIGRALNRMLRGGIRHGTGNECEDRFLRFYQKGGDGEVDTNPIAMLSKGEVFQLARALEVPQSIIEAIPSPDLHGTGAAHNDEDELEATYGVRWRYSRISFESGEYTHVGSIERMSRLLDEPGVEGVVFGDAESNEAAIEAVVNTALDRTFAGFEADQVRRFVESARHIERATRHKHNPNCPTLGERASLLQSAILSNELPEV